MDSFFTLMISEIASQEVKISSTSKTLDMSDISYSQCGSLDLSIFYHALYTVCANQD